MIDPREADRTIIGHMDFLFVDKRGWPPGPWHDEPDKRLWYDKATGYQCMIARNRAGSLCGYVGLTEGHPFYGKSYNKHSLQWSCKCKSNPNGGATYHHCTTIEDLVPCHGGVTYADGDFGHMDTGICGTTDAKRWWIGFDCAHAGDYIPIKHTQEAMAFFNTDPRMVEIMGMITELKARMSIEVEDQYRDVAFVEAEVAKMAGILAALDSPLRLELAKLINRWVRAERWYKWKLMPRLRRFATLHWLRGKR